MKNLFDFKNADYEKCCTSFYEDDLIKYLLGDSFHPGGIILTNKLATKLHLRKTSRVLDIASGLGTSSIEIAKNFDVNIIGIDLSSENIKIATLKSKELDLSDKVTFQNADAEDLPFPDNYFDAIISECSYCIFPNKEKVMAEMFRVLKPDGILGISDVVINNDLPYEFDHLIFIIACISGAQSELQYLSDFKKAGFISLDVEDHKNEILSLHKAIKKKIFLLEMAKNMNNKIFKGINLSNLNFDQINDVVDHIKQFVEDGYGSYSIIVGRKPNN